MHLFYFFLAKLIYAFTLMVNSMNYYFDINTNLVDLEA